jgi:redox-sensing transcriptional repressor
MSHKDEISVAVIKRLPRYYRFFAEMKNKGVVRVSSGELSARLGLTASQIRQDFNRFGNFGHQGYGYNVAQLHQQIGDILGLSNTRSTILIGAGNLGKAVANHIFGENSVHKNAKVDRALKKLVQKKAMKHYGWSIDRFREIFGKNYI